MMSNAEVATEFLKAKGLHREVTVIQAMFRQAHSFSRVAALLLADLSKTPSSGFTIAPFAVNLAFAIELYLKTLGQVHGVGLRGHDLARLFAGLPPAAIEAIDAAIATVQPGGTRAKYEGILREMADVFTEWRYIYEHQTGPQIKIQPGTWVANVLFKACRASGKT